MTTQAALGIGTLLQYGDNAASPESFTTLSEVKDISVSAAREFLDVTNQDSPNQSREYIGGLTDVDEFTVECNLTNSAAQLAAIAMQESGEVRTWQIVHSSTRTLRFEAIVSGYAYGFPVEGAKTLSLTFRITGGIVRVNE